jgi:protein phosphatase 1L
MEDRYSVKTTENNISVYAVFDGHGGARASEFCVDFLLKNLTSDESFFTSPPRALTRAFLKTDEQFLKVARSGFYEDGTTSIVAIVRDDEIFVGNAGDSRAMLIRKDTEAKNRVVELSQDHKPNRRDEQERIEKAGGIVVHVGVWRVEGVLAVSRAIGDRAFKDYVIARPDVLRYERTDKDAFLVRTPQSEKQKKNISTHKQHTLHNFVQTTQVLASDGLWDVMSNQQVADEIQSCTNVESAAKQLTEKAYRLGSRDNICSLVVDLRNMKTVKKRRRSTKKKRRPTPPKGGVGVSDDVSADE